LINDLLTLAGGRSVVTHRRRGGILSWLAFASVASIPALPAPARAHEIPADVVAHIFVKPEGGRLRLLVRVPLEAMRDVDFPLVGGDYLDLARAEPFLRDAAILWIADQVQLYEDGRRLPAPELVVVRASIPSDRSFDQWSTGLDRVTGAPLDPGTLLVWRQALLDVLLEVPIADEAADFSVRPGLERLGLRVVTVLRFLPPGGTERALELTGDPGVVSLDPSWVQAALSFVRFGFLHILGGVDHLLFLFCLVIPFRRIRGLVAVVTAFTVAHSITLVASAYGMAPDVLWFPPLVETLIAASIVYMALENVVGASLHRRWVIAFGFGLVHGFGFSFALRETLQFAGAHLVTSLLSFNVGVELGQLLVLVVLVPALNAFFRYAVAERVGTVVLSVLVAHTGWHWMADRFAVLRAYEVGWHDVADAFMTSGLRWLALALILGGLAGALGRRVRAGTRTILTEDLT
ncbi:MAG TPA: HupE/UreJ family protein, partial [Longimicrobiales bacterium]|nr:HupE/UreJ family protein [Longimicrobiales bacterium]